MKPKRYKSKNPSYFSNYELALLIILCFTLGIVFAGFSIGLLNLKLGIASSVCFGAGIFLSLGFYTNQKEVQEHLVEVEEDEG